MCVYLYIINIQYTQYTQIYNKNVYFECVYIIYTGASQ